MFLASFICLLILCAIFQPWQHSLSIPYEYTADALFCQMLAKNVIESGSFQIAPRLGYPFAANLYDFPLMSGSAWFLMSGLALLTNNPFTLVNLFHWLGFLLAAGGR